MHPIRSSFIIAFLLNVVVVICLFFIDALPLTGLQGGEYIFGWLITLFSMNTTVVCTGVIVHYLRKFKDELQNQRNNQNQ